MLQLRPALCPALSALKVLLWAVSLPHPYENSPASKCSVCYIAWVLTLLKASGIWDSLGSDETVLQRLNDLEEVYPFFHQLPIWELTKLSNIQTRLLIRSHLWLCYSLSWRQVSCVQQKESELCSTGWRCCPSAKPPHGTPRNGPCSCRQKPSFQRPLRGQPIPLGFQKSRLQPL